MQPSELVLAAYCLCLAVLATYNINHFVLTVIFLGRRARTRPAGGGSVPRRVTIQLPIYNEYYVAARVIESACRVDYPWDLLEIQVLDDSTDDTLALTRALVARYRAAGLDIVHLHREDRTGYKGGALRFGLERARGEFLVVFDADFVIPTDFLEKTISCFDDPTVGVVQTRWAYFNRHYSSLTECTALMYDSHFVVEQAGRSLGGMFLNFNGTGGVLRRRAVVDAGGWQDDTLTEDLDLSYRMQLRGWKLRYLWDVTCSSEVPADMNGVKSQQFRWMKGGVESAKKLLVRLWRAPVPARCKVEGTIHLLSPMFPYVILGITLLNPLVILIVAQHTSMALAGVAAFTPLAFLGSVCCVVTSAGTAGGRWVRRLQWLPLGIALATGLCVSNAKAVTEGLAGVKSGFVRTPKYHLITRHDGWSGTRYRSPLTWSVVGELLLGVYSAVALTLALRLRLYAFVPFCGVYTWGYAAVAWCSLQHAWAGRTPLRRSGAAVATLAASEPTVP